MLCIERAKGRVAVQRGLYRVSVQRALYRAAVQRGFDRGGDQVVLDRYGGLSGASGLVERLSFSVQAALELCILASTLICITSPYRARSVCVLV